MSRMFAGRVSPPTTSALALLVLVSTQAPAQVAPPSPEAPPSSSSPPASKEPQAPPTPPPEAAAPAEPAVGPPEPALGSPEPAVAGASTQPPPGPPPATTPPAPVGPPPQAPQPPAAAPSGPLASPPAPGDPSRAAGSLPATTSQETRAAQAHTGTFFRFHVGYANLVAKFSPYGATGGSNFGFTLGGTLTRGFALAGMLDFASDGSDEGIFVGQYAVAFSYYFLPLNVYAGGSMGMASGWYEDLATDDADKRRVETESAFSYTISLGYEYLFEDSAWGLGPSVKFWQSRFNDGRFSATAVVLSATYH